MRLPMLAAMFLFFIPLTKARNVPEIRYPLHGVVTAVHDDGRRFQVIVETDAMDYAIECGPTDHLTVGTSVDFRVIEIYNPQAYMSGGKKERKFSVRSQIVKPGKTSEEYPLEAHVVAVKMQTGEISSGGGGGSYTVWDSRTTSHQVHVPYSSSGSSYEWHLMMTVIGDKLYGLSVPGGRHNAWLHTGTYAFKEVRGGFEMRYNDETGRLRTQILAIRSEEPAPKQ